MTEPLFSARIVSIHYEAKDVLSFTVKPLDYEVEAIDPGSHIDIHLPNGMMPSYSLSNGPSQLAAYRREESAQRVPISLQSFSGDSLDKAAVESTEDLTSLFGGLVVQPTAARPMVFLRGVGSNSSNTPAAVTTFLTASICPSEIRWSW